MDGERLDEVLLHIDDAQSWLSRARTDYRTEGRTRGELDLVLAQAEAKYAWELSRGRLPAIRPNRRRISRRGWLPLAAGLVLIPLVLAAFARWLAIAPGKESAAKPRSRTSAPADTGGRSAGAGAAAPRLTDRPGTIPSGAGRSLSTADVQPIPATGTPSQGAGDMTAAQETDPPAQIAPAPLPERQTSLPSPEENLRTAGAENGLAVDLNELTRVAQETLGETENGGR